MTKPNRPDVALLERLNSERTQGKWDLIDEVPGAVTYMDPHFKRPMNIFGLDIDEYTVCTHRPDAAFIAAAANEMTGLLEYVRKLERVAASAKQCRQKELSHASVCFDRDVNGRDVGNKAVHAAYEAIQTGNVLDTALEAWKCD